MPGFLSSHWERRLEESDKLKESHPREQVWIVNEEDKMRLESAFRAEADRLYKKQADAYDKLPWYLKIITRKPKPLR